MKDKQLRKYLGLDSWNGPMLWISSNGVRNPGLLLHLRDRIESIERYLGIKYESSPSHKGYPKHIKEKK
jgi:hypothetical protein